MKSILSIILILAINYCSNQLRIQNNDLKPSYEVVKIDSTQSMYLIQIKNDSIKELVLSERNCKMTSKKYKKIITGRKYYLEIDPLNSYFNDDDFEKMGLKVDNVDVKKFTQGKIYMSNNLCGLYIAE